MRPLLRASGWLHLLSCEMRELPQLVTLGFGQLVEPVPFAIELIRKLFLIFAGLFLDIELERANDLFARRLVSKGLNRSRGRALWQRHGFDDSASGRPVLKMKG
jgi:hypothetical protein